MTWRGAEEAVAVADTGSFTAAANALKTTVASVSRRVSELELRLGVKLFTRTTRKVTTTQDGDVYIAHCRDALKIMEDAGAEVTAHQAQLTGHIRVTAAVEFGERMIAPSIASFQLQHPDISVELDLSNDRFDLVEQKYDLAIRLGEFPDSSLIAQKIGERRLQVCASPSYLDEHGIPKTIGDLKHHNCLRATSKQWRFVQDGRTVQHRVTGNTRCNSGVAITGMVLRGLGIAQLPDYYVENHITDGNLITLLDDLQPPSEGIWIVRPDNRFVPRRVREFMTLLTKDVSAGK